MPIVPCAASQTQVVSELRSGLVHHGGRALHAPWCACARFEALAYLSVGSLCAHEGDTMCVQLGVGLRRQLCVCDGPRVIEFGAARTLHDDRVREDAALLAALRDPSAMCLHQHFAYRGGAADECVCAPSSLDENEVAPAGALVTVTFKKNGGKHANPIVVHVQPCSMVSDLVARVAKARHIANRRVRLVVDGDVLSCSEQLFLADNDVVHYFVTAPLADKKKRTRTLRLDGVLDLQAEAGSLPAPVVGISLTLPWVSLEHVVMSSSRLCDVPGVGRHGHSFSLPTFCGDDASGSSSSSSSGRSVPVLDFYHHSVPEGTLLAQENPVTLPICHKGWILACGVFAELCPVGEVTAYLSTYWSQAVRVVSLSSAQCARDVDVILVPCDLCRGRACPKCLSFLDP
eukprot:4566517-Amphidinium_carterae.1